MELSTRARYAVEAVIDLALCSNVNNLDSGNITLNTISKRVCISVSYLEQLFAKLRRASIVTSSKGPKGGYRLAKELDKITILDIIKAVNEKVETRSCKGKLRDGKGCRANGSKCYSHILWDGLLNNITGYLSSLTLYDVIYKHNKNDIITTNMEEAVSL